MSDAGYEERAKPRHQVGRTQAAWFLSITALTALAIVWGTRPTVYTKFLNPQFVSYGSLLLCSSYQSPRAQAKAQVYASELEPWLSDPDVFKVYLARNHVLDKIAERAGKVSLDLLRGAEWVSITPSFGELRDSGAQTDAPDYAVLTSRRRLWQRPNRISVECLGRTPEEAKSLTQAALSVVGEQFVETATRVAGKKRKRLEGLLRVVQSKSNRADRGLEKLALGLEPDLTVVAARVRSLEGRAGTLQERLRSLSLDSQELRDVRVDPELQELWEANERDRIAVTQIYLQDAPDLQALLSRRTLLTTAMQERQSQRVMAKQLAFRTQESKLQQQLAEVQRELEAERSRIPDSKQQLQLREVGKELSTWEAEALSLQKQVLEARIEEQSCKNSAITVVLQEALPGKRLLRLNAAWQERYRLTLKYLPLSFLGGAVALALIAMLRELRDVHHQVVRYCDAPVLAEIRLSVARPPDLSKWKVRSPDAL